MWSIFSRFNFIFQKLYHLIGFLWIIFSIWTCIDCEIEMKCTRIAGIWHFSPHWWRALSIRRKQKHVRSHMRWQYNHILNSFRKLRNDFDKISWNLSSKIKFGLKFSYIYFHNRVSPEIHSEQIEFSFNRCVEYFSNSNRRIVVDALLKAVRHFFDSV